MGDYITLEDLQQLLSGKLSAKEYQYYDSLLNHRTILFNDVVDEDVIEKVILPLKRFEEDTDSSPITLILNTPGGSISDGLVLINIIDNYTKPLNIIVYGYSCSMGTLLLTAGNDNPNVKKMCYPYTFLLFHPGHLNLNDNTAAAMDYIEYSKKVDAMIRDYIINNTNIPADEYDKRSRQEWYMLAEEAKQYGLIDEIIGVDCNDN